MTPRCDHPLECLELAEDENAVDCSRCGERIAAVDKAPPFYLSRPWRPAEVKPLVPGVLIDDEARPEVVERVWPVIWRHAIIPCALAAGGLALMYFEGHRSPQPGVGFVVGMGMLGLAVWQAMREDY